MTFLPIVDRELRLAARRGSTYWLRSSVALGVMIVSAWIFLVFYSAAPRAMGRQVFYFVSGGALLYCLLAGTRSTADCLSAEKREGTLGLLFLTDLKGYDVVGGKLVANSINACYGLLTIVPVLAVTLLMGGVTPGECGRMALVLVDTLFLSLSVGMCVSAMSRSWRRATAATVLWVLFFTIGCPMLGEWLQYGRIASTPQGVAVNFAGRYVYRSVLLLPSPTYAYELAHDLPFKTAPAQFYWSVGTIHALGWLFLGLATLVAPRSWQDRPASAGVARRLGVWQRWCYGSAAERKAFRDRLLDRSAFCWLAARERLKPARVWGLLGLLACGWVWGAFKGGRNWFDESNYVITAFVLNSVLKGWFALETSRQLSEDRKLGALELLLSTPLTVRDILRGQRLALQRQFLGPLAATLLAEVVMMLAGRHGALFNHASSGWICLWIAAMVMLAADLMALYWMGLWMGLSAKSPRQASNHTIVRVLVLPWVGFLVFLTLSIVAATGFQTHWSARLILGVWLGLGLMADVGYGFWARHKLLTQFREVATQRYPPRATVWSRLSGGSADAGGAT